jgi:hypothetical protein
MRRFWIHRNPRRGGRPWFCVKHLRRNQTLVFVGNWLIHIYP